MSHIVVLPGWEHGRESWKGFVDHFGAERVTVIELPGFGNEPLVSSEWGVPEYVGWVREKVDALGYTDVVLMGHSFGGRVASMLASEKPEWLEKLVLYGAPCIYRPSAGVRLKIIMAKMLRMLGLRTLLKQRFGNPELNAADSSGIGQVFRRAVSFDQTDTLPHIAVPTLLLWGEKDTDAPVRLAREIKTLIPHAELSVLPGLGHNVHIENPNLFYGIITRFLQSN
jgi:pimeloyl-ACP methyl ester carboxylesterase